MDVTYMPFIDKADHEGNRVMTYECCADWFDGYQCTLWDNTDPTMPVCTMRVYIDTHTHTHTHMYIYVYHMCMYMCMFVYMCERTCVYAYLCVYVDI